MGVTRDPGTFREASAYYMAGRPPYSRELLPTLERELSLDGHGRLLDVGSGPGVLVVELAPVFDESVAVDPDPGMLAEGERRAEAAGQRGIRWIRGVAEELGSLVTGTYRLVTFGQSYHWTAGMEVLDTVHELLEPGGTVALIGHCAEGRPEPRGPARPHIPEAEIVALVREFTSDASLLSKARRSTPRLHQTDLRASLFGDCRTVYAPGRPDIVRDVDSIVAGYYSTSYAAPRRFGDSREAFEAALRALLWQHSPEGLFWDWPGDTEIVLATK
ncbi:MAG: class I SAM-dependent methyltransferase [Acidimicrobiales bacterium]